MNISIHRDYLIIDGKPRFLFGGDFNYTRTPREHWHDRLLKMKAAGMNTVTFYATWAFHEISRGGWEWAGQKDVAAFLDMIHGENMWAIARLGPFVHGEWRNGGLPQWMLDELGPKARTNDSKYLKLTRIWYEQILAIVAPRLVTRGGPVIIIQMENELGSAGSKGDDIARGSPDPDENAKHVLYYHQIIKEHGVDVPIIDINHFPGKDDLPNLVDTGGGYPANCFGSDGDLWPMSTEWWDKHTRPKITIETGSGMFVRYFDWPPYKHTRGFQGPVVTPEITEALTYLTIAEGANGVNYYILVDGQHCANGNERMLPERDMNFQAPITVTGNLRESYRCLKRIGWFLRAFEQDVLKSQPNKDWAQATSYGIPHPGVSLGGDLFENYHKKNNPSATGNNFQTPPIPEYLRHVKPVNALGRVTRGLNLGESNFLFMLNTANHGAHWLRDIRVMTSPRGIPCEVWQEYPKKIQMDLPPQRNKCMPFFVRLSERVFLEYSTAELLDRRPFGKVIQVILHAEADELTETRLVLPQPGAVHRSGEASAVWDSPNTLSLLAQPGPEMEVIAIDGDIPVRVILMERSLAGQVWDIPSPAGDIVASSNLRLLGGRVKNDKTILTVQTDESRFFIYILSPLKPSWKGPFVSWQENNLEMFGLFKAHGIIAFPKQDIRFQTSMEGPHYIWEADIHPGLLQDVHDLVLRANYEGTLGRAWLDNTLISDHAFGRWLDWEIGLRDHLKQPGRLRIEFQNCHKADVILKPIIQFETEITWSS